MRDTTYVKDDSVRNGVEGESVTRELAFAFERVDVNVGELRREQ